jgi:regulator of sigma E protease
MQGEDAMDESPGSFNGASVWGRICVVAAGPVFNFILAFVLAVIIVGAVGSDPAKVLQVTEGSNAEAAGLKEGDVITSYQGYHVDLGKDIYVYSYLNELTEDQTINLTVNRDGETLHFSYTPDVNVRYLLGFNRKDADTLEVESLIAGMPLEAAGVVAGDVITGIDGTPLADGAAYQEYITEHPLSDSPIQITWLHEGEEYTAEITPGEYRTPLTGFTYNVWSEKQTGLNVLKYGFLEVKYLVRTTILSLKELFGGSLGMDDLSGPVGVVDAIGTTYEESKSEGALILWMNMLNMAVLLSANLGVMNLLPLPALDGGRLVFLVVEAIRRKPINRQVEGTIHFAGLMLLMVLMVVIMYHDIVKIF